MYQKARIFVGWGLPHRLQRPAVGRPGGASPTLLAAFAALFAGCTVGPDYVVPQESAPAVWSTDVGS